MTDIGAYMLVMVKTNTKGLFKDTTNNLTRDYTGGSYPMLKRKSTVTRNMPLIAIDYKYSTRKVIYFIYTEDTGRKKDCIPYLYKYHDQFDNVAISPVACNIFMSELFVSVNEVESHKKSRHSDLVLENTGLLSVFGYGYKQHLLW